MSHPTNSSQNPGAPRLPDGSDVAPNDGSREPAQRRQTPLNQARTSVHATPSSATAVPPPTPLTAAHGGNLGPGLSGMPQTGEPGRIWGRVQTPFATNLAATQGTRMSAWATVPQPFLPNGISVVNVSSAPIHPGIRHYARIAALLYAARIRPSDAPPFARELALAYPMAQALALDLARHAGSPRSRRRRRHMTLRRVNVFTIGKLAAYAGTLLVFLRIWTVLSLALSNSLASFLSMDDVNTFLTYLVSEVIDRPHERALYNELVAILQHDNPFEALSTPVSIANVSISPLLFIGVLITTPLVAGAICFVVGACIGVACNVLLSVSGGIRLENHDD